jgi:tryptophanyl-tRNA synthetase
LQANHQPPALTKTSQNPGRQTSHSTSPFDTSQGPVRVIVAASLFAGEWAFWVGHGLNLWVVSMSLQSPAMARPVILTGDTPTGQLHLGHYVGSVRRRVELQSTHECYFIIANIHAFTTRADRPEEIRRDSLEIVRDYIAMGIDPAKSTIFLQSEVPAISELTYLFAMLLPFNRVMRNPTLKDEIKIKGLGENYSFGFPLYAVGQTADILAFRAHSVPVGEDQVPHLELTREVARRFNQMYCGVNEHTPDHQHTAQGGVFPVPVADVGKVGRLVGIDGVNKMSKSLGNAIFITDDAKTIKKKIGQIYTGRQSLTEPGDVNNALFQYVECFIPDQNRIAELRDRYARGDNIGDGHIKAEVADAVDKLLAPMRARRAELQGDDRAILQILKEGCQRAIAATELTLALAKDAAKYGYFPREVRYT